jgi:hypothetical protein
MAEIPIDSVSFYNRCCGRWARRHDTRKEDGDEVRRSYRRPKTKVDVGKLLDAYRECGSVGGAARVVWCKPGTAHDRLREAGVL